ncbi:hypothetical protein D3C73_675400 [compost metagenome]
MTHEEAERNGVSVERSSLKSAHERIVEMLMTGERINLLLPSRRALPRLQPSASPRRA